MPPYSWLLSSLLVSQIGGNPPVPVTVAPPTTGLRGPASQPLPIRGPLLLAVISFASRRPPQRKSLSRRPCPNGRPRHNC